MNTITNSITLANPMHVSTLATPITPIMNVEINAQAPVVCSKHIVIKASPQKVWAILTDINNWSYWQTDISKPKLWGLLQPGARFYWKTGGVGIHSTLHTVVPNKAFGWTGKTFGMYAIHNWTLTEVPGGTQVSVEESMQGLLASLLKKSFNQSLASGMQHWLELLKSECER